MKKTWKKTLSLALAVLMTLSLAACGKDGGEPTPAPAPSAAGQSEVPTPAAENYPAPPAGPVTIQYWHGMSGVNEEYVNELVDEFNKSNSYGITVEATYQGKYPEILSKTSAAIAAKESPNIIMMSSTEIPVMAETGSLADLSGFIARDGIDMDNFVTSMMAFTYYDGMTVTLPYLRSVPILYYNKTMFDEMGLHEPTSFEDLTEMSKTIYEKSGGKTAGAGFLIDTFFYQEALVRSLGADGILKKDGSGPACLDDGSFEKMLRDWQDGINAGYFINVEVTNTSSVMKEALYNGELGAMLSTSGNLANFTKQFKELPYELGVCAMPVYGGLGGNIGGGNLGIIAAENSDNEIAATWEFMKFMLSDEKVAEHAIKTGYLPVTYGSVETQQMKDHWAADPNYRIAFDILDRCADSSWCKYQNEYNSYLKEAISYVIQDKSWTPEQAVEYLKEQAETVFVD